MSDDNGSATKAGAWTNAGDMEFLMHIIAAINDGKGLPWSKINVPGRTQKSLQNRWTKINKDLAEIRAANGDVEAATPTPRKRAPKKKTADDEGDTPVKAPKKRAAPAAKGSAKKVKKEEPVSDGDEDPGIKSEEEVEV